MHSIAQRLRHVREVSGIGPKALALTCGLGSSHVHMIEAGDVDPGLGTLRKIADKIGVPVAWLAFGEGECPPDEVIAATIRAANDARRARKSGRLGATFTANDFSGPAVPAEPDADEAADLGDARHPGTRDSAVA